MHLEPVANRASRARFSHARTPRKTAFARASRARSGHAVAAAGASLGRGHSGRHRRQQLL